MAADTPHAVATFAAGSQAVNTLANPWRDLVIPLQEDLDGDPLQDDEVRIASHCGRHVRVLLASSPEAEADHAAALVHYRFRQVPPGCYSVAVRVGEQWVAVSHTLVVTPRAAYLNGRRLPATPPPHRYLPRQYVAPPEPAPAPARRPLPRTLDLNSAFQDRPEAPHEQP